MKKHLGLLLLIGALLFNSCNNSQSSEEMTFEELGELVFEAIINDDFDEIKSLMVTLEELEKTVENSDLPESQKVKFKSEMTEKFNTDKDKTLSKMESGFEGIQESLNAKSCGSNVNLGEIKCSIRILHKVPFKLGNLELRYECEGELETVNVEIIKTDDGWRVLEKIRLVDNQEPEL